MGIREPKHMRIGRPRALDTVYVGLAAALMAVCAQLQIPMPWGVPITLQTLAVFAVVDLLGVWRGCAAVTVYLVLGALGLPVFSGGGAGLGMLFGVTGGYLWGFLPETAVTGGLIRTAEAVDRRRRASTAVRAAVKIAAVPMAMIAGMATCYLVGTLWFKAVYAQEQDAVTWGAVLARCVLPYLLPDAVKLALAVVIVRRGARWIR